MAETKITYGTDAAFTVTNLHSIASSTTKTAGWTSASVSNLVTLAMDYLITGQIQVNTTTPPTDATSIELWAYAPVNDTPTWPDLFSAGTEGTEGTATIHDEEQKASGLRLLWSTAVDTSTSDVHTIPPCSIARAFGDVPSHFALFVTHNTGQTLSATTNALYYMPITYTTA